MPSAPDLSPTIDQRKPLLAKVVDNVRPLKKLAQKLEPHALPLLERIDRKNESLKRQKMISFVFDTLDKRENYLIRYRPDSKHKSTKQLEIGDVESIQLLLIHQKSGKEKLSPRGNRVFHEILTYLLPTHLQLGDGSDFAHHKENIQKFIHELKERNAKRHASSFLVKGNPEFTSQIHNNQSKFISLLARRLQSELFIRKKTLEKAKKEPSSVSKVANLLLSSIKKSLNINQIETISQFEAISEQISNMYNAKKFRKKKYQSPEGLQSKMTRRQVISSTVRLLARNELLRAQKNSNLPQTPRRPSVEQITPSLQERTQTLFAQALLAGSFALGLATPDFVAPLADKTLQTLEGPTKTVLRPVAKVAYEILAPVANVLGNISQEHLAQLVRQRLDLKNPEPTSQARTGYEKSIQTVHELAQNPTVIEYNIYDLYLAGEINLDTGKKMWNHQAKTRITELTSEITNYFFCLSNDIPIHQLASKSGKNTNRYPTILSPRDAVKEALRFYLSRHPDTKVTFATGEQIKNFRTRKDRTELESLITLSQSEKQNQEPQLDLQWFRFLGQHQNLIAKKEDLQVQIRNIIKSQSYYSFTDNDQKILIDFLFGKNSPLVWDQDQVLRSVSELDDKCPVHFSPQLYDAVLAICQKIGSRKVSIQDLGSKYLQAFSQLPPLKEPTSPQHPKTIVKQADLKLQLASTQYKDLPIALFSPKLDWSIINHTLSQAQNTVEQFLTKTALELSESDKSSIQESLTILLSSRPESSIELYDNSGNLLEIAPASGSDWRFPITFDDFPAHLIEALVSTEDGNFWTHQGLDSASLLRAASPFSQGGGASGLSAQLVKLTLNTPQDLEKQYASGTRMERKKHETLVTILYEQILKDSYAQVLSAKIGVSENQISPEQVAQQAQILAKKEIITRYLNTVYFGRHALGVEAASRAYFDKNAKDLTQLEAITLVSFIQSPGVHPANEENATQRRNVVLDLLRAKGVLNRSTWKKYKDSPLGWRLGDAPAFVSKNLESRHFLDQVPLSIEPQDTQEFATKRIATTLDSELQAQLQAKLTKRIGELEQNHPSLDLTASAVVVDVRNATVLAHVGNASHEMGMDWVNTPVNPGSILKPLLAAWLIRDHGLNPASPLPDQEILSLKEESYLAPVENNGAKSYKNVTLEFALANSLNRPFVHALEKYGLVSFVKFLQSIGVESLAQQLDQNPNDFSSRLILGSNQYTIKLSEMAQAYQMLFNHGKSIDLHYTQEKNPHSTLLHPNIASSVTKMLQNRTLARPAFASSLDNFPIDVAVKTGTSSPNSPDSQYYAHDNLLVAYDEQTQRLLIFWLGDQNGANLTATPPTQIFSPANTFGLVALELINFVREHNSNAKESAQKVGAN